MAHDAENGQAVDARRAVEIDHGVDGLGVEAPIGFERRCRDGVDAFGLFSERHG
jgi:hypothetical protein